jgi:hypothetical protein
MSFWIQVSNPIVMLSSLDDVEDISTAIEAVFPTETEDAILVWNGVYVPINYKYDISVIYREIMDLVRFLLTGDSASTRIEWPSNTFRACWDIERLGESIRISSVWYSVAGGLEETLNQRSIVELPRSQFLAEWKILLRKLIDALEGLQLGRASAEELLIIKELESRISDTGRLYQK